MSAAHRDAWPTAPSSPSATSSRSSASPSCWSSRRSSRSCSCCCSPTSSAARSTPRGDQLPRVPHRRDLRPDRDVRRDVHRRRARRRHAEGHHRPLPLAADVALGGAHRAHRRATSAQRPRSSPHVADRPARRLAHPQAVLDAVAGFALLLLFAYAFSWVMAYVGLSSRASRSCTTPRSSSCSRLTFIANTFVPPDDFPAGCRCSPSGTRSRR